MSRGGRRGRWAENGFEGMGGYMAAKKAKLEGQFSEEAKKEGNQGIFDGVAIFVNGYSGEFMIRAFPTVSFDTSFLLKIRLGMS